MAEKAETPNRLEGCHTEITEITDIYQPVRLMVPGVQEVRRDFKGPAEIAETPVRLGVKSHRNLGIENRRQRGKPKAHKDSA